MGHTLVTRFDPQSRKRLSDLMAPFAANKIPYGRKCDREAANRVLDYHVTVLHWAKTMDAYYLERLRELSPAPCLLSVTRTCVMSAEEGSWLLYFQVEPGEGFADMVHDLENKTGIGIYLNPHITLAVSRDRDEIDRIRRQLDSTLSFPLQLRAEGLDLYHIWVPTQKVKSYGAVSEKPRDLRLTDG